MMPLSYLASDLELVSKMGLSAVSVRLFVLEQSYLLVSRRIEGP